MSDIKVPQIIIDLVENFKENEHIYKSSNYDEENTKVEFINPFFKALGWDVYNEKGKAPQYKEVVFEDTIKIDGKAKAPDYSFRLGGQRIFFVEAKKPSVDLKQDRSPAFQVRRYGWSAKLKLCILTDFEELAIYETTTKPERTQNASIARIAYYKYTDYVEKWDEIYNIFSKEAVEKGSFDNFADGHKGTKKGTSEVDEEFLKEIDNWRLLLARNISRNNLDLNAERVNYAVQLTIDRIIFLRIAEDRGMEKYKTLFNLSSEENIYKSFIVLCKKADAKYNSGLFNFIGEDGEETPSAFTAKLNVDNSVLKKIFKNLYYPNSPYEFSVLPAEILGSVYERFLGKVIRLTPSHQAKIEEKPEVQKAGGVYYTPQYIVDYIVKNTIGELLKNKTPNQVSKLRFVDPACGSGSFLLGAYQYLLDWHLDYYLGLERPPSGVFYKGKDGVYRLSISEKKRILVNNIFGVDIDTQAVEVTKLSLLLKVLEDQNKDEVEQQQKLFQERALPHLGNNIKCGNSLIGTDILEQEELTKEQISMINPFDWEEGFPEIFENGRFDVVIGNPPYFNIDTWGTNSIRKKYIKKTYKYIWRDKTDILFYFIDKAISISKSDVGYIVSNAFLFADKSDKLRNFILDNAPIKKIVNFEGYKVFKDANISTCVIFLNKSQNNNVKALGLERNDYTESEVVKILSNEDNYFDLKLSRDDVFPIKNNLIMKLNKKIDSDFNLLGNLFYVGKGMETGANKIFGFKEYPNQFPEEFIKERVDVSNIRPYFLPSGKEYILFYEFIESFKDLPDVIKDYLKENRTTLNKRATVKNEGRDWWKYNRPLHKDYYKFPRIFSNYRNDSNKFAIDENKEFIGYTNSTVIFDTNEKIDLKYLLALLNSKVLTFRYQSIGKKTGNNSYEYFSVGISKLPIPEISLEQQKPFIDLVDKMIDLNKELNNNLTPKEKRLLEKQIEVTDKKINQLVYELYDLTDEEIHIVEDVLK